LNKFFKLIIEETEDDHDHDQQWSRKITEGSGSRREKEGKEFGIVLLLKYMRKQAYIQN